MFKVGHEPSQIIPPRGHSWKPTIFTLKCKITVLIIYAQQRGLGGLIPLFQETLDPTLFGEEFHPLNAWLDRRFEQVEAGEFYRELFPVGCLEKAGEEVEGRYRGIALRIKDGKPQRFFITDGLEILEKTSKAGQDEFWLASPVSYAGRSQRQSMSRFLYAVAIDLDSVRVEDEQHPRGLEAMWNQIGGELQPRPTFIVSSGSGLHLYYMLERPIAMYKPVIRQLQRFRHDLITRVWSSFVTEDWERPQYESVTQGFRMVGTYSKEGKRLVRAWRTGERVDIEYLNRWVKPVNQLKDVTYQSRLTLSEAKEKYPEWYQARIVEGRPRGSWTAKPALYEWWRDQKLYEAKIGHRYYYLMSLAIYAIKSGISQEQLHADAWRLFPVLKQQDSVGNPLLESDLVKALQMYDADYQTFPRRTIAFRTGINIPPNKRNGRKQATHLRGARALQDIDDPEGTWRNRMGAPTKREQIKAWRAANPQGRKIDCERETGISRPTVLKWWDA